MPEVAQCDSSKMEGIITCENTEGSNPQSVQTNVANEESNEEYKRTESASVHAETHVNVNENIGRPRRNSAQAARHKIQAVLAWEGCCESSAMFQNMANKIEEEFQHETKRRRTEDEEEVYDGVSDCHDVDETDSMVACSEPDSYGRDSFVVSDDDEESVKATNSDEEEYFSATSDPENSSNGDSGDDSESEDVNPV